LYRTIEYRFECTIEPNFNHVFVHWTKAFYAVTLLHYFFAFVAFVVHIIIKKMVKKQTKASRLQAAKKRKQLEQARHDTEATNNDVDVVTEDDTGVVDNLNDKPAAMLDTDATSNLHGEVHASHDSKEKAPNPPDGSPDSKEKAPDPPDKHPDLQEKQHAVDKDTGPLTISNTDTVVNSQDDPPDMSNEDGAVNVDTTTNVGAGVAIDDNYPFAINGTTTNERVDTGNISNVEDGVGHHDNDGDESTIPDDGTKDDQVLDAAIPRKRPSRPMAPEPELSKIYKCKSSLLLYFHIVFISIFRRWTIEMRMNVLSSLCVVFTSIIRRWTIEMR
jgi:hypothetical protein